MAETNALLAQRYASHAAALGEEDREQQHLEAASGWLRTAVAARLLADLS